MYQLVLTHDVQCGDTHNLVVRAQRFLLFFVFLGFETQATWLLTNMSASPQLRQFLPWSGSATRLALAENLGDRRFQRENPF